MQNLKKSVKSKGVVVFAFNTTVDYVAIADQTSRLIEKNLGLPITLITDHDSNPKFKYDWVLRVDPQGATYRTEDHNVQWRNFGRYLAYDMSPYDETILLDTDYLVLDDSLLNLLSTDFDYKLMHHNCTPSGNSYEMMGETSLPFVWATVVLFRKSPRSQALFNMVGRIQRNYQYYRQLYNIREGNYRNDYAFAIANNIVSGYSLNESQGIPWTMFTVEKNIIGIIPKQDFVVVRTEADAVIVPYQNIHVMDKQYLLSDNFKHLVETVCAT